MTRQDFIFILFDNGDGMTLDQIAEIEKEMKNALPSGMIEELQEINGMTRDDALETALTTARDVFMDDMQDCEDLLALRRFLNSGICNTRLNVTDMQVFRLWYVRED